jgi:hypothetical protein
LILPIEPALEDYRDQLRLLLDRVVKLMSLLTPNHPQNCEADQQQWKNTSNCQRQ